MLLRLLILYKRLRAHLKYGIELLKNYRQDKTFRIALLSKKRLKRNWSSI